MAVHVRPLTALVCLALAAAGCAAAPARGNPARLTCRAPWTAGSRLPGSLNPAYPTAGLYPAPGGQPPPGVAGLSLAVMAPALVLDYGQPLEAGGVTRSNAVVRGTADRGWWRAEVAAGYPFRLFGPEVPLFGVVPAPVRTGKAASGLRTVWLVTEWDAPQTLTVLRGSDALTSAGPGWQWVPGGVTAAHEQGAAARIRAAEAAGWQLVASVPAQAACGAGAGQIDPFGDRAELRLPLGVPLLLVSPEFGGTVLEFSAGPAPAKG